MTSGARWPPKLVRRAPHAAGSEVAAGRRGLASRRAPIGLDVSAVTEQYIQKKAEALRPIYQDREDKLRKLLGLPILEGHARDQGEADDVLSRLRTDPDFKKMVLGL